MDVEKYTIKRLVTNLALLEEHLKEFAQGKNEIFCLDCEMKHILLILGYSEECVGFKCNPQGIIKEIAKWADNLSSNVRNVDRDEALQIANKCRDFRKKITTNILGSDKSKKGKHL